MSASPTLLLTSAKESIDAVVSALTVLGREDKTKPQTVEAARTARVLLETQPIETLVPRVVSLWEAEYPAYLRRYRRALWLSGLMLFVCTALYIICLPDDFPRWIRRLSPLFNIFLTAGVTKFFLRNVSCPLHTGMLRFLDLRPYPRFVPLLIDRLSAASNFASPVDRPETRALLTRYLPLWCEEDNDLLSPARQRVLIREITVVTRGASVLYRPVGEPRPAMTLADADFALAANAALRHCRHGAEQDTVTRRVLSQLPPPTTADDPRQEIYQTAQALLVGRGR